MAKEIELSIKIIKYTGYKHKNRPKYDLDCKQFSLPFNNYIDAVRCAKDLLANQILKIELEIKC